MAKRLLHQAQMSDRRPVAQLVKWFLLGSLSTLLLVGVLSSIFGERVNFLDLGALLSNSSRSHSKPAPQPPCGLIEAFELPLANTEGRLRDEVERFRPPRWCFDGFTAARLTSFLQSCGLTRVQTHVLLDKRRCTVTDQGCEIEPPDSAIWQLSKAGRERLYAVLAKCPRNYPQRYPFRFQPGTMEERLSLSGLHRRDIQAVNRLTDGGYRRRRSRSAWLTSARRRA